MVVVGRDAISCVPIGRDPGRQLCAIFRHTRVHKLNMLSFAAVDESANGMQKEKKLKLLLIIFISATAVFLVLFVVFLILWVTSLSSYANKYSYAPEKAFIKDVSFEGEEVWGGAVEGLGQANIKKSPYYPSYDFYNGVKPTDTLLLIRGFKTMQQSTEYTGGPAAAKMVLEYYGETNDTEADLAESLITYADETNKLDPIGTTTQKMVDMFREKNYIVESSIDDRHQEFGEESDFVDFVKENLKQGYPILVESLIWGGQWNVIIGYDNMGKEDTASHVLIMCDSWDTTDHNQDGYIIMSLERFFAIWTDYEIQPEGQREQQYVVVKGKSSNGQ